MSEEKILPFDSFSVVYKVLIWAGCFKLLKPKNRTKWICHQIYRSLTLILTIVYNLQHIIFIVQRRHNKEDVFDALMVEVAHLNLLAKFINLNLQMSRIDKVNRLLSGSTFAGDSKVDEDLLLQNKANVHRLTKLIYGTISLSSILWPLSYAVKRYQDPTSVVPSYVPFETDTWTKYSISIALEVVPLLWTGYGHISLDFVVATYYAQAEVQLKIIKHNLEHLFDSENIQPSNSDFKYKDLTDIGLKDRFIYYVKRYEKLTWYTKEIDRVFNPPTTFQLFSSTISLCIVTYEMSFMEVTESVTIMFLILLVFLFATQIFIYCYFGNSVQYESQQVMHSLYLSDWLSVSPRFRRMLLIAMIRWSRPLKPTVYGVIPLSLNTFISICRSAYSLFAVLSRQKS